MAATDERLIYEILSAVGEFPAGSVATYGQIARLIGRPKNARLVGRVLSQAERYGNYPCHRVVDHSGRLVPGWDAQAALLAREGVALRDAQHVDLRRYQWQCSPYHRQGSGGWCVRRRAAPAAWGRAAAGRAEREPPDTR